MKSETRFILLMFVFSDCHFCEKFKESECGNRTAQFLMAWQMITIAVICVLDVVGFLNWKESDRIDEIYDRSETFPYVISSLETFFVSVHSSLCF